MGVILPRLQRAERTDVDDVAAVAFEHYARGSLATKEHRLQIDVVNEIPILLFNV